MNDLAVTFIRAIVLLVCVALLPSAATADDWVTYEPADGAGKGKHIVLVAGEWEYRCEEGLPMLAKILSQRHGFKCTVLFPINPENGTIDPNVNNNVPGLELLAEADMMIVLAMDLELPDEQMKHFVDFINSGKPVLGFRCSVLAFRYENDKDSPYAKYDFRGTAASGAEIPGGFGMVVLGETWRGHHGHHAVESTRGLINGRRRGHPILRGVKGDIWGPTDVYQIDQLPDNAVVLAYGQVLRGMKPDDVPNYDKPVMPMVWAYEREVDGKPSRVVTSTIGAAEDLESEDLRRIVVNGVYWCLEMEDQIPRPTKDNPAATNVDYVGEFVASPFGRDKFKPGLRPADLAL
ncbi:MAG: hypothetical protein DWQ42_06975 [Planctomycetota bacterium]|nr:MAG: hypothetical protein DWQ42_06975 [Planctomycetota bacterium]REK38458.1 MAG: hypothetical protein DWQ46_20210 [Planctomycetota bacterium]